MGSPRVPCCLREITPLGEVVDQLVHNELDDTPHHDHLILPDDKVLYLAEETRTIDDTAKGGDEKTNVTGDVIRVWDQRTGTTQKLWTAFDHLSTDVRVEWGDRDPKRWTHFNSLQIGRRGNIIVSSRNRNQVISIAPDYRSIEWFLGGPNSYSTFPDPADKFYRQHTATELPNGNILVFDNGAGGEYSRALELALSPNPPMDRDGWREDSGRGEGVTGAMIRARIRVDGRLAGGLQALLGAPMAAYSGCGERDGGIGHGKRRSRTGLVRVCGDVGLAGGSVADGRRQAGSGMARSRARARLNCSSQGQRRGRCRVNRRAERVIRPARAKTRRLRVLVVTIC